MAPAIVSTSARTASRAQPDVTGEPAEPSTPLRGGSLPPRRPWYASLPYFVRGDLDAFVSLFSNNLATMLIGAQLLTQPLGAQVVYDHVIPGIAASMCFGCVYYSIQAQLKSAKTGRLDLCAQPFGINTPGVFAFNSGIILPVYFAKLSTVGSTEAMKLAWQVGVLANFVQGATEVVLSLIGPYVAKAVPMVALLGSLASIGIAFLFTSSFQGEMFVPLVGLVPFFVLMMALYANVKVPKLPSTLVPVALGTVVSWVSGFSHAENVSKSTDKLGWHPCRLTYDAFENFNEVAPYIAVIIPVALTVSVGTIQCRQLAANAGDEYNLRASMLGDGIATLVAAVFGSPYGMTVFIGHSAFKEMGAKIGYTLMCAVAMLLVCFSGAAALLLAIFPIEALNPILLFVGLAICSDALHVTPSRHWPAFMLSLVPCFCNWCVEQAQSFGRQICGSQPAGQECIVDVNGGGGWTLDPSLRGLYALGQGYLLTSIYLTSMLVFVIDRKFLEAGLWSLVAAVSSSCGLIHSDVLFLPWLSPPEPAGHKDLTQWDKHWEFVGAYGGCALVFLGCAVLQGRGHIPRGPVTEEPIHQELERRHTILEDAGIFAEPSDMTDAAAAASKAHQSTASQAV